MRLSSGAPPTSASGGQEGADWVAGRKSVSPQYDPQPPTHRKGLIFVGHKEMEPPNSILPKSAETGQPIQVLHGARTGASADAGRGRATVPPPKPHPQCTRRERRTRAKGLGVFAVGPPVPLARGLRSSRGRRRSPLPLLPWRRHSSRPGPEVAKTTPRAKGGGAGLLLGGRIRGGGGLDLQPPPPGGAESLDLVFSL